MKKLFALLPAVCFALALSGCAGPRPFDLSGTATIGLKGGHAQNQYAYTLTISSKEDMGHIVDNLNSLSYEKLEYTEPCAAAYELRFYDARGEQMTCLAIPYNHPWVSANGCFHTVGSGELDLAFLEELLMPLVDAFSYEDVLDACRPGDPGVYYDGFDPPVPFTIDTIQHAIELGRTVFTIPYDQVSVAYDAGNDMWQVSCSTRGTLGNCQDVYFNSGGIIDLIVYGE